MGIAFALLVWHVEIASLCRGGIEEPIGEKGGAKLVVLKKIVVLNLESCAALMISN